MYALNSSRIVRVMELSKNEQSELTDIAWHWESAYIVSAADGFFIAARLGDPHQQLTADTTAELRELIRKDYQAWMASLKERSSL